MFTDTESFAERKGATYPREALGEAGCSKHPQKGRDFRAGVCRSKENGIHKECGQPDPPCSEIGTNWPRRKLASDLDGDREAEVHKNMS